MGEQARKSFLVSEKIAHGHYKKIWDIS